MSAIGATYLPALQARCPANDVCNNVPSKSSNQRVTLEAAYCKLHETPAMHCKNI